MSCDCVTVACPREIKSGAGCNDSSSTKNSFIMGDVNVFILGASGYIGAAVLDLLYAKHPEYHFIALLRSPATGKELLDRYPLLRPVIGDLENEEVIETESKNANIVISTYPFKRLLIQMLRTLPISPRRMPSSRGSPRVPRPDSTFIRQAPVSSPTCQILEPESTPQPKSTTTSTTWMRLNHYPKLTSTKTSIKRFITRHQT